MAERAEDANGARRVHSARKREPVDARRNHRIVFAHADRQRGAGRGQGGSELIIALKTLGCNRELDLKLEVRARKRQRARARPVSTRAVADHEPTQCSRVCRRCRE